VSRNQVTGEFFPLFSGQLGEAPADSGRPGDRPPTRTPSPRLRQGPANPRCQVTPLLPFRRPARKRRRPGRGLLLRTLEDLDRNTVPGTPARQVQRRNNVEGSIDAVGRRNPLAGRALSRSSGAVSNVEGGNHRSASRAGRTIQRAPTLYPFDVRHCGQRIAKAAAKTRLAAKRSVENTFDAASTLRRPWGTWTARLARLH
jgi:hypothetical protein